MASMIQEQAAAYGKFNTVKTTNRKPITYAQFEKKYSNRSDKYKYDMIDKINDYRTAGVKVVWHIFTTKNEVHVYSGTDLTTMNVCQNDTLCSAAPVLPQFTLSVTDIFKLPTPK